MSAETFSYFNVCYLESIKQNVIIDESQKEIWIEHTGRYEATFVVSLYFHRVLENKNKDLFLSC